uniref:Cytoskeleton associated protein 2 n=1 Tax=Cynoglossus semilaevis TaxID=244447 RepID=A0A3P8W1P1_CYNSE
RDKTSVVPFHLKSNEKEEGIKTLQKQDASSDVTQQQTHRKAFRRDQAEKNKKITTEAPVKAPTALQAPKPAPGMYKGKIVQSKIGSIWRSSTSVDKLDTKTETQRKMRSKSVDLPPCRTRTTALSMTKAALTRTAQESNRAVTSRPPAVLCSARPPTRTMQATLTTTSSRNRPVTSTKQSGSFKPKPKVPVTDKKVNKPPVTSSLSQYRCNMETIEERRAKLAEWLASKGKTLKRPAMTAAPATHTRVSKPGAHLRPQSSAEAVQCKPEHSVEVCEPDRPAECAHKQGAEQETCDPTEVFINTTVELLETSEDGPDDDQDNIVVNLCEALEAMETPSTSSDAYYVISVRIVIGFTSEYENLISKCLSFSEVTALTEENSGVKEEEGKLNGDVVKEMSETESEPEVKSDNDEDEKELESEEEYDDDVIKTTPKMDASVVKYSVRTTPYLQSVKKTIDGELSTSRRKSNIKDLKFLTPVRRSTRIQRKSSRLPEMLVDHDTCVSSLAELVKLDDDPNAYIYRKNPALLEDLPDQLGE